MTRTQGSRIYFDVATGNVILNTGDRAGEFVPTSIKDDINTYTILNTRVRSTFDVIELSYGQYYQDFLECNGYRVNVATKKIEFSYPDPNAPATEPVYIKPLSVEIEETKQAIAELTVLISTGGK